jgi:hypothetical protein
VSLKYRRVFKTQKVGEETNMATIVNTTPAHEDTGSGMGFLLGILLLIAFIVVFFFYGVPALTQSFRGPQVNVPGQIDVNVQTPQK